MSNFNISYLYSLRDKFSSKMKKINNSIDKNSVKLRKAQKNMKSFGESADKIGKKIGMRISAPLAIIGGLALRSSAKMETMTVGFEAMLGSAEKANKVVKDLFTFTAKTPFQLDGVASAGRMLLAAGVSTQDLNDKLQFLGDISSAANVPIQDMAKIFMKTKNKGKAMTEEILQMAERGIPIIAVLSEQFGITGDQVFKAAEKGQLSFKIIERAMIKMAQKGGFANQAMAKQSKTLGGLFSTLKDNVSLSLGAIGDSIVKNLNLKKNMAKLIVNIQNLTSKFIKLTETNPKLIKIGIILGLIGSILGPIVLALGLIVSSVSALIPLFIALTGPVGLIVAGIAALAIGGVVLYKKWKPFRDLINNIAEIFKKVASFSANVLKSFTGGITKGLDAMKNINIGGVLESTRGMFDANINLTAPKGTVQSVKTKEKKGTGMNLGFNMVEA